MAVVPGRVKPALDLLAETKVLVLGDLQQQVEVGLKMRPRRIAGDRFGRIQREHDRGRVGPPGARIGLDDLDVVDLVDEDRVREDEVQHHRVVQQVPGALGLPAHLRDRAPHGDEAARAAERIPGGGRAQDRRAQAPPVEARNVVGLQERVDDQLPVHRPLDLAAREERVARQAERSDLALRAAEVRVDVDRLTARRSDEDHPVPLGHRQRLER